MNIRRAAMKDADRIRVLLEQLDYSTTPEILARQMERMLQHLDEVVLVAESAAGEVVGFLSLHFVPQIALPGDIAVISYFCVDQHARSAGIGGRMEGEAVRLAEERGCCRMEVHSHTRREGAHRFYLKQGYTESPKYFRKQIETPSP